MISPEKCMLKMARGSLCCDLEIWKHSKWRTIDKLR